MVSSTTVAVASMADIPEAVRAFAQTLGFAQTTVSPTSVTVQHPTYATALTFTVSSLAEGTGASARERLVLTTSAPGGTPAWAESPKLNRTQVSNAAAVTVEQPTKVVLFGQLDGDVSDPGESYIAGVIAYGFNLYRHFYLGYVNKCTDFEGGEIVTGCAFCPSGQSTGWRAYYDGQQCAYPFQGSAVTDYRVGGVYTDHPVAVTPWRQFSLFKTTGSNRRPMQDNDAATINQMVMGGFQDDVNDGYMRQGFQPFSGSQILTPINLYIGLASASPAYKSLAPIGHPGGVRLVDIVDLEPEAVFTLGGETWQVFPVFQKSALTSALISSSLATSFRFVPEETSQYVGMAYKVGS